MTSHSSQSYTFRTSRALPTPYVPSTIVRTLCVATVISRLRARARFFVSLCRRNRRSALPRRLRLRAKTLLLLVFFSLIPLSLHLFLPYILVSRRGFSRPTPRRSAHFPSPGRIWCLLTGSSPPSHFPRWHTRFDATTVGTNDLACRFNWQCIVDTIDYAGSWSQHAWTPDRLLTSTVGVHPDREAAGTSTSKRPRNKVSLIPVLASRVFREEITI